MSENTARKAVVTTAQVQEKVNLYAEVRKEIAGLEKVETFEFDKGMRGKGFATYDSDGNVVETFEGKEEALTFYNTWINAAWQIKNLIETKVAKEATSAKAPRKVAAKVAEGSQEGDSKAA